jgi:hypothetical protein
MGRYILLKPQTGQWPISWRVEKDEEKCEEEKCEEEKSFLQSSPL